MSKYRSARQRQVWAESCSDSMRPQTEDGARPPASKRGLGKASGLDWASKQGLGEALGLELRLGLRSRLQALNAPRSVARPWIVARLRPEAPMITRTVVRPQSGRSSGRKVPTASATAAGRPSVPLFVHVGGTSIACLVHRTVPPVNPVQTGPLQGCQCTPSRHGIARMGRGSRLHASN